MSIYLVTQYDNRVTKSCYLCLGVAHYRYWAVIDQSDFHVRLEYSGSNWQVRAANLYKLLI